DLARRRFFESVDAPQQGRLAGPAGPDDADDLAGGDGEVDAFEHFVRAEALAQLGHLDSGDAVRRHRDLAIRRSRTATNRVSGTVINRYSIAAISSGVALAVLTTPSRANVVISRVASVEPAMNSSEGSLMSSTNSFVSGGITMRKDCGRMMEDIVMPKPMPGGRAATVWPFATPWMPARITSAM